MTESKSLYFIAILPDPITSQRVMDIKELLNKDYGLSYAQRLPALIALQSPFLASQEQERKMELMFQQLADSWKPFSLQICDYKREEDKMFFLEVCQSDALNKFQADIIEQLENEIGIPITLLSLNFCPHITLAFRDTNEEVMERIWSNYSNKKFDAEFEVHHLVLFKHQMEEWTLLNAVKLK